MAAREQAANEIKEVKEKLDLAKLEYADEVATARENSQNELSKIREETATTISEAREKAKTEKAKTAEDVVNSKKTASEQILQVKEETAEQIGSHWLGKQQQQQQIWQKNGCASISPFFFNILHPNYCNYINMGCSGVKSPPTCSWLLGGRSGKLCRAVSCQICYLLYLLDMLNAEQVSMHIV